MKQFLSEFVRIAIHVIPAKAGIQKRKQKDRHFDQADVVSAWRNPIIGVYRVGDEISRLRYAPLKITDSVCFSFGLLDPEWRNAFRMTKVGRLMKEKSIINPASVGGDARIVVNERIHATRTRVTEDRNDFRDSQG